MAAAYYGPKDIFHSTPSASRLVVIVHGTNRPGTSVQKGLLPVMNVVQTVVPDADCFLPRLPTEYWRFRKADQIADDLLAAITKIWQEKESSGRSYEEVILVGFSFGSVLTRSLYCRARGLDDRAELPPEPVRQDYEAPWVRKVSRIVLLAGMNRGWTKDSPVSRFESLKIRIGSAFGHLAAFLLREPTLFAIRRGAPFLTTMRLQWLALIRDRSVPVTIQLLGTKDDLVSPADNIDLATGQDFIYLEVPDSGHFDVVDMSPPTSELAGIATVDLDGTDAAQRRGEVFRRALNEQPDLLKKSALVPSDMDDRVQIARTVLDGGITVSPDWNQIVLFVIHGIRDRGYWTKKIARRVKEVARERRVTVQSVTSSYGYFAMLPFLLESTRREKVEWFLDEYVTARTLCPNAAMYFVGHSNGTYLLGAALERCRAVKFENVVLAGSVLRRRFDWERFVLRKQIANVLNYVATSDWVVAIFPRIFEIVRVPWLPPSLGSAGHNGFVGDDPRTVVEREYVEGRHAAALDERHWDDIARFVLAGPRAQIQSRIATRRSAIVTTLGYLSVLIWAFLIAVAVVPAVVFVEGLGLPLLPYAVREQEFWKTVVSSMTEAWKPWMMAAALGVHIGIIRLILTKL